MFLPKYCKEILVGLSFLSSLLHKRRSSRQGITSVHTPCTLNRRAGQPQSLQQDSAQLYDQTYLCPSTGQAEYIPKSKTTKFNIDNPSQTSQNSRARPTYSTADEDIAKHSSALNVGNPATTSQLPPQNIHESTSEQPTYAAVDISKKKKFNKQIEKEDPKNEAAKKGPPVLPYLGYELLMQKKKENAIKREISSPHTTEDRSVHSYQEAKRL